MKRAAFLEHGTLSFSLVASLCLTACVAPAKNVGFESETEGETESETSPASDSDPTDASESSTSGASGSTSGPGNPTVPATESDSAGTGCDSNDQASCQDAEECAWIDIQTIDAGDDFCGFGSEMGICVYAPSDVGGCSENHICADNTGYWYREAGEGSWDVTARQGDCLNPLPGFNACRFDDSDPDVCSCACLDDTGASLPPGFEDDLEPAGCGDISIYARNSEDTIGMRLAINENIVDEVRTSLENYSEELDFSAFSTFELEVGEAITHLDCNDAVEFEPMVARQWLASSGTVSLEVVPSEGGADGAFATVTLNNVQMVDGGDVIVLDGLTFESVFVGWFPG